MVESTDSGLNDVSTIIRGNVGLKIGTWTAGPSLTAVAIASGGTAVLAGGANVKNAPTGITAKPVLVNYSFVNGNPNMTITPGTTAEAGTYWMFVKLS